MEKKAMFKRNHIAAIFGIIALHGVILGCRKGVDLDNLRADQINWSTYTNSKLGYTISYPAMLQLEEFGDGSVLFRNGSGGVPILVRYADEQEGKKRDLEKYLGVESRTPNELNEIQKRMLASFKLISSK
jgi:hypothetical protein